MATAHRMSLVKSKPRAAGYRAHPWAARSPRVIPMALCRECGASGSGVSARGHDRSAARRLQRRPSGAVVRLRMAYVPGDYVYPADMPRRLLCRVARAESGNTDDGAFQILMLEPLEGPWREWPDTRLIVRLGEDVLPAPSDGPRSN